MTGDDEPARPRTRRATAAETDRWFREQGLPTFVPLRRWFVDLPRRVAPLAVFVMLLNVIGGGGVGAMEVTTGDGQLDPLDTTTRDVLLVLAFLIIGVVALATAITATLIVRWLLRRTRPAVGTFVALAAIAGVAALQVGGSPTLGLVVETVLIVGACVVVTAAGGGALVSWASRLAVRNAAAVAHMASIALPVILMVVIFAFFSAELWQVTASVGWPSLLLVGCVVGAVALVAVLRVAASEIDELEDRAPADRRALLAGTPAEGMDPRSAPRRLRRVQRINLLLVMAVAQLAQAAMFALLLATLLVVLGGIVIPHELIEVWLGPGTRTVHLTVEPLVIAGLTLPVSVNLLKTAALLATIATLPFVFSAVSEPRYRERFFDPIMDELRRAIAVLDTVRR